MKKLIYLKSFLKNSFVLKINKRLYVPKVGDNIWIKFLYLNGLKTFKFYTKTFFGRCISIKRRNSNNVYLLLRNVFNRDPIELSFFLNSPFVLRVKLKKRKRYSKFTRNKLYYLRYKKIAESKIK